ncbi:Abi family protein [Oceanivirga salmonicida]|uniref:Abi family protein n=1 Tax=Oceanivirga salmonicida TaxID=1769291 RepID=UPI0008329077|nr:Abi family protein [Oceanivirga salmonicida]
MNNEAFDIIYQDTQLISKISKLTNVLNKDNPNLKLICAYIIDNRQLLLASVHGDIDLEDIDFVKSSLNTNKENISLDYKKVCIPFTLDNHIVFLLYLYSNKEINVDEYKSIARAFSKIRKKYNKNLLNEYGLIELLKNKNLTFENEEKAKSYLKHTSYYELKDFAYVFMNNNKYKDNISFDEIRNRIDLDKKLRFNLLALIEIIEISIKTNFAKILSKNGPLDYLKFEWCHKTSIRGVHNSIERAKDLLKNDDNNYFVNLYKQKYFTDDIPILILMEKFTLGSLNDLIDASHDNILEEISKIYSLSKKDFQNYLSSIKELRNRAAHNNNILDFLYDDKHKLETVVKYIEYLFNIINKDEIFEIEKNQLENCKTLLKQIKY